MQLNTIHNRFDVVIEGDFLKNANGNFMKALVDIDPRWTVQTPNGVIVLAREYFAVPIAMAERRRRQQLERDAEQLVADQAENQRKKEEFQRLERQQLGRISAMPTILMIDDGDIKWFEREFWLVGPDRTVRLAPRTSSLTQKLKRRCPEFAALLAAQHEERKARAETNKLKQAQAAAEAVVRLPRSSFFNSADLRARDWTDGGIKRFLSEPHHTGENPFHRSGPEIKYWLASDVEKIEHTPEFVEWLTKSAVRKVHRSVE